MKAVIAEIEEIKRLKNALEKTNSEHLRRDYSKAIDRKLKDVREYCTLRNIEPMGVKVD